MADSNSEASILVICDVIVIFIFIVGVLANSLVLLVFYRKPGLRTVSNRFVINLVATNLAACFVELPLVLLDNLLGPTPRGRAWLCAADEGITAAVCSASILAVLLIALDQYWAVVDPLRYHARIGAARSAGMILSGWIIAFVVGIFGSINLETGPKPSLWYSCGNSSNLVDTVTPSSNLYSICFAVIFTSCIFILPFGAILWIYICIYTAAHRNSQRTRRRGSTGIVTNYPDRQYFPIVETQNEIDAKNCLNRQRTTNLHRSQTFAEGNVRTEDERNCSEEKISTRSANASDIGAFVAESNDNVKSNSRIDRPSGVSVASGDCNMTEAESNLKKSTTQTGLQGVLKESPDEEADRNSGDKSTSAMFSLGAPEKDSKSETQVILKLNLTEALKVDSLNEKLNANLDNTTPKTPQTLKQTCFSHATLIPSHSSDDIQELSTIIPKNTLDIDDSSTSTEKSTPNQSENIIKTFPPIVRGLSHSNSMPTVTITPPQVVATRTSLSQNSSLRNSGNIVSTLRSRISNASLFRYREEMRAARISALVIIMALVNWLPYYILIILHSNFLKVSIIIPHYVNAVGLMLLSSGALVSPCLFAYRNRKLQREVKKVLGFSKAYKDDGSFKRDEQSKVDLPKKNFQVWPLSNNKKQTKLGHTGKFWKLTGWKSKHCPESRFIESNLLQHNVDSDKEAGLLLSCMKGSRWVQKEGVCDLSTLHNTALRTSVDTCRSSFSSGGSTNSTQCTSTSLDTALEI